MTRLPEQATTLRTTYTLRRMLQRGFTGVRDCGGATKIIAQAIDEGLIEGPRLFQCGKAISQTGGHGDFAAVGTPGMSVACCGGHNISLGRVADGVPAVLKAVREELKQGADFIKIMLGGGVASECDAIETVQYSMEEVKAVTTAAWQYGKKMVSRVLVYIILLRSVGGRLIGRLPPMRTRSKLSIMRSRVVVEVSNMAT